MKKKTNKKNSISWLMSKPFMLSGVFKAPCMTAWASSFLALRASMVSRSSDNSESCTNIKLINVRELDWNWSLCICLTQSYVTELRFEKKEADRFKLFIIKNVVFFIHTWSNSTFFTFIKYSETLILTNTDIFPFILWRSNIAWCFSPALQLKPAVWGHTPGRLDLPHHVSSSKGQRVQSIRVSLCCVLCAKVDPTPL